MEKSQYTIAVLINTPLKNNYHPWVVHNNNSSTEINIQAQMVHYLERYVVIRAKFDSVGKIAYSTLGLLSTVCG